MSCMERLKRNFYYLGYYCTPNLSIHQNSTQKLTWNFLVTLERPSGRFCYICFVYVALVCTMTGLWKNLWSAFEPRTFGHKALYLAQKYFRRPVVSEESVQLLSIGPTLYQVFLVIVISVMFTFWFCPKIKDKHCREHYDYGRENLIQSSSW